MSKKKGYISQDASRVFLPHLIGGWGYEELSKSEANRFYQEMRCTLNEVLKKKPSRQTILFLKLMAEEACEELARHVSESEENFLLPSFKEKVSESLGEVTYQKKQYVDWEECLKIFKCNNRERLTLSLGEFPKSGRGRIIDELYVALAGSINFFENLKNNSAGRDRLILAFNEELCAKALELPPLSNKSVNSWAEVINRFILVPYSQLDLSNYHRNIKRLENQITAANQEIRSDAAGIKETELLILKNNGFG